MNNIRIDMGYDNNNLVLEAMKTVTGESESLDEIDDEMLGKQLIKALNQTDKSCSFVFVVTLYKLIKSYSSRGLTKAEDYSGKHDDNFIKVRDGLGAYDDRNLLEVLVYYTIRWLARFGYGDKNCHAYDLCKKFGSMGLDFEDAMTYCYKYLFSFANVGKDSEHLRINEALNQNEDILVIMGAINHKLTQYFENYLHTKDRREYRTFISYCNGLVLSYIEREKFQSIGIFDKKKALSRVYPFNKEYLQEHFIMTDEEYSQIEQYLRYSTVRLHDPVSRDDDDSVERGDLIPQEVDEELLLIQEIFNEETITALLHSKLEYLLFVAGFEVDADTLRLIEKDSKQLWKQVLDCLEYSGLIDSDYRSSNFDVDDYKVLDYYTKRHRLNHLYNEYAKKVKSMYR